MFFLIWHHSVSVLYVFCLWSCDYRMLHVCKHVFFATEVLSLHRYSRGMVLTNFCSFFATLTRLGGDNSHWAAAPWAWDLKEMCVSKSIQTQPMSHSYSLHFSPPNTQITIHRKIWVPRHPFLTPVITSRGLVQVITALWGQGVVSCWAMFSQLYYAGGQWGDHNCCFSF